MSQVLDTMRKQTDAEAEKVRAESTRQFGASKPLADLLGSAVTPFQVLEELDRKCSKEEVRWWLRKAFVGAQCEVSAQCLHSRGRRPLFATPEPTACGQEVSRQQQPEGTHLDDGRERRGPQVGAA